ncbi:hypothetical protein H6F78_23795 [Coleofasciculus sp. FACHB-64]|uniref:hypothetical protein n=1 Tax=Cyanophyceae TaxID=3028117 RepID=UPI00168218DE|nr:MULTISPECIES: hypothetical protein [unclassified Coleofasciculus]MBD1837015.1 hypothetical protein [Coleofasciculus sp. FACHB-501]MBD1877578.1 hypothetical protein [Coleofasciculus sp. FACHB-T130]MBD1891677.1 hypothetical protein [Coleofasciculus sp. FACHB-SPT9]MBD1897971.1 hypothetical protein [Coleofasciculus sp. FACHB-129]MBD1902841.1 hypothetical protein [Coleofasciculus sp. FACHB-125]
MNNQTDNVDSSQRVGEDNYDRGIVPAETAARREREGNAFKTTPGKDDEEKSPTNDQTNDGSIDTTDGYTVDKEGLLNNYAIEPEMYVNEPGDLKAKEEAEAAERAETVSELQDDEEGKLTMEGDKRHQGPGLI